MIDLYSIQVMQAVVAEGSFARAAVRMNTTQSAISYQIKKLEEDLGIQLFDRSSYRTELTAAGQTMLEEGKRLLEQAQHIHTLAERFTEGWEPKLKVVIDGVLPMEPILNVLKMMADENVPTKIQVKVEFLGGVQYRFEKEEADLMLVKDYQPNSTLIAHPIAAIELLLVVASKHPLATLAQADLNDLHHHVELTVHDSSEQQEPRGDRLIFGGDRIFYMSDFNSKKQAIMMGLGFGWLPMFLIEQELQRGELTVVAYRGGSHHRFTPMVVHRTGRPLGKTGTLFQELVMQRM